MGRSHPASPLRRRRKGAAPPHRAWRGGQKKRSDLSNLDGHRIPRHMADALRLTAPELGEAARATATRERGGPTGQAQQYDQCAETSGLAGSGMHAPLLSMLRASAPTLAGTRPFMILRSGRDKKRSPPPPAAFSRLVLGGPSVDMRIEFCVSARLFPKNRA